MKRTLSVILPVVVLVGLLGVSAQSSAVGQTGIAALPPVTETDGRAGLCYSFYTDPGGGGGRPFLPLAYDAGSRWDRFDFAWPRLEKKDGWDASVVQAYDELVSDLTTGGFDMVGILLWTPDWAATSGVQGLAVPELDERPHGWYAPDSGSAEPVGPLSVASAASSPPQNLYAPWYSGWKDGDGGPVNYWGRFVYQVVDRYKDQVKHWEMWNEPDWSVFWTGDKADYAQLLKVGYQATKAACTDCQVLFGGLLYWTDQTYYADVLDILAHDPGAQANDYFFDVMSVHFYSRSSNTYDEVNKIRAGMRARGADHPIWITETGVPLWGDDPHLRPKYDYAARPEEAAAYVIQSYAYAWASGVEKYFFFRTHDADMPDHSGEYFGMMRNDRSPRPTYLAYQVATTYLISPSMVTTVPYANGVRRVTLWGTPWGKVSVIWNATPNQLTFDYPATLPTARRIDQYGGEEMMYAGEGVYKLELRGATANRVAPHEHDYFIGGEPYLVIEGDTVPPSKAIVEQLPATTRSRTVLINASASDDAAGIWGFDLEVRQGSGPWEKWGRFDPSPIAFTDGEDGETYCFRARAWDRAGNPGPWGDEQPCTTVDWPDLPVRMYLPHIASNR